MDDAERQTKRLRTSPNRPEILLIHDGGVGGGVAKDSRDSPSLKSLHRSVTPPPRNHKAATQAEEREILDRKLKQVHRESDLFNSSNSDRTLISDNNNGDGCRLGYEKKSSCTIIPSPIQLTYIRDLAPASGNNDDTVRLRDILGDPMIRECWQFNYLFDVDFLMNQFDDDVRTLVQVKVVHGSWKKDAPNRIRIDEACARYPNVEAITAYMPEPFGTHHSKMMILLRHDDLAQAVIHTANMIPQDWTNMCQAVWRSPLLPLLPAKKDTIVDSAPRELNSGQKFKRDLLAYLEAYGNKKVKLLIQQLRKFDFQSVRAALIASVPSKQKLEDMRRSESLTPWGWPALKNVLSQIPLYKHQQGLEQERDRKSKSKAHIVIQISSIASLGQTDKWLKDTVFASLSPNPIQIDSPIKGRLEIEPKISIIFPTPDEIRRSLDGYGSGGSIHMKLHSKAQQMQLQYMRRYLCHWAGDVLESREVLPTTTNAEATTITAAKIHQNEQQSKKIKREAGRRRAAPHIKTYVRFSDAETMDTIDWAMVTSANLSTQAWGTAPNANGEVRICSWEIGVIVWPDLFAEVSSDSAVKMLPCFKTDLPTCPIRELSNTPEVGIGASCAAATSTEGSNQNHQQRPRSTTVVGFRMPYDLPLTPYSASEVPWCATARHTEPDWLGQIWNV